MIRSFAPLAVSSRSAVAGRSLGGIWRQLASLATALCHRREIGRLCDLDDRALKDIGLLRSDVDGVLAEPFYRDPSQVLVRSVARPHSARLSFADRTIRPVVPVMRGASKDDRSPARTAWSPRRS